MDVRCEGCKTEYEFDDVLLSARGTSVKCTKCGNIFRVKPPEGVSEDRWTVDVAGKDAVEFTALRDLQRAITQGKIAREDVIRRKGLPARALGEIIELDSLFRKRDALQLANSEPPPDPSARPSAGPPISLAPQRSRVDTNPSFPPEEPVPARVVPPVVDASNSLIPSLAPILAHTPSASIPTQATDPFKLETKTKPIGEISSPLPPMSAAPPPSSETVLPPIGSDALGLAPKRKKSVGGFFVLFIVLSTMGGAFLFWSRERANFRAKPAASVSTDSRVASFTGDAVKALAAGNFALSRELVNKATLLSESDTRVRGLTASIAAAEAEVAWLRARVSKEIAPSEMESARKALETTSADANRLVDGAIAGDAQDADLVRAKAMALVASGDRENARKWMQRAAVTNVAENAYVLAMLDMAEDVPLWSPVIDRLKQAVTVSERARAALVYAAAMSGDQNLAREQIEKMERAETKHPVLGQLVQLVNQRAPSLRADAGVRVQSDAGASENSSAKGAIPRLSGRDLATQVESFRKKGEWGRAREVLLGALENSPNDVDVLTMLGQVAQAERKVPEARGYLGHALSLNSAHLPALLALGDLDWDAGNRAQSKKTYTEIVDRFPEGVYPSRVKQRLEAAAPVAAPAVSTTASANPAAAPSATAAPTQPASEESGNE